MFHGCSRRAVGRMGSVGVVAALLACLALWSVGRSSGSGSLEANRAAEASNLLHQTLVSLWANTCPAKDPVVKELRKGPWPNRTKGEVPKVTQVVYINLEWDGPRKTYMEAQLENLSHTWKHDHDVSMTWERLQGTDSDALKSGKAYKDWREKGFSKAPHP